MRKYMLLIVFMLFIRTAFYSQCTHCILKDKSFACGTIIEEKEDVQVCNNGEWSVLNENERQRSVGNLVLNKDVEGAMAKTCYRRKGFPYVDVSRFNADIYFDDLLVYSDYRYSRSLMGDGGLDCNDIHMRRKTIAMRYGHKNDLILVFALDIDQNGDLKGIYRHFTRIQDGENIIIKFSDSGDVLVVYGRHKDINQRWYFNWDTKKWWIGDQCRVHKGCPPNHFPKGGSEAITYRVY